MAKQSKHPLRTYTPKGARAGAAGLRIGSARAGRMADALTKKKPRKKSK